MTRNEYARAWRAKNRDALRAYDRAFYAKNRDAVQARVRARRRVKRRGTIHRVCVICGTGLQSPAKHWKTCSPKCGKANKRMRAGERNREKWRDPSWRAARQERARAWRANNPQYQRNYKVKYYASLSEEKKKHIRDVGNKWRKRNRAAVNAAANLRRREERLAFLAMQHILGEERSNAH